MRQGSIYVYRDPASGRAMYVGSTQDGNTLRRHGIHLKEKRSIGPWLRSFAVPPVPTEIRKYSYETTERLHACENHFMRVLSTLIWLGFGGMNKRFANPYDHTEMGRVGGKIGGAAVARMFREGKLRSYKRTPETRKKQSDSAKLRPDMRNSPEANRKKVAFHTGRKRSEATKEKISSKAKLRVGVKNPFFGRKHSDETKEKIAQAKRGKNHPFFGQKRPEHSARMRQYWAEKREGGKQDV